MLLSMQRLRHLSDILQVLSGRERILGRFSHHIRHQRLQGGAGIGAKKIQQTLKACRVSCP